MQWFTVGLVTANPGFGSRSNLFCFFLCTDALSAMALMFMLLCLHMLDSYVGTQRRQAGRLCFLLCCLARVENSGLDLNWELLA